MLQNQWSIELYSLHLSLIKHTKMNYPPVGWTVLYCCTATNSALSPVRKKVFCPLPLCLGWLSASYSAKEFPILSDTVDSMFSKISLMAPWTPKCSLFWAVKKNLAFLPQNSTLLSIRYSQLTKKQPVFLLHLF